jgi:hypothetical protein
MIILETGCLCEITAINRRLVSSYHGQPGIKKLLSQCSGRKDLTFPATQDSSYQITSLFIESIKYL